MKTFTDNFSERPRLKNQREDSASFPSSTSSPGFRGRVRFIP
jgi:hypothetical protein